MKPLHIAALLAPALGLVAGCSSTSGLVQKYATSSSPAERWKLICERPSVTESEYGQYFANQASLGNDLAKWKSIKLTERQISGNLWDVDFVGVNTDNGKDIKFQYAVHRTANGLCVQFVNGGRLLRGTGSDFVANEEFSSTALLALEPSDYYNYATRDLEGQFYSAKLLNSGDTGLDTFDSIFIKKSDDPDGKIYAALRRGGAFVKGDLARWTPTEGLSFDTLDDFQRNQLATSYVNGVLVLWGGDNSIKFLNRPSLITPQFAVREE
ncbi:MAG: hypothetical protein VKJ66_04030 [Synechococcus sp.]|nr:hypothetical protein [Synechococcus sp.]